MQALTISEVSCDLIDFSPIEKLGEPDNIFFKSTISYNKSKFCIQTSKLKIHDLNPDNIQLEVCETENNFFRDLEATVVSKVCKSSMEWFKKDIPYNKILSMFKNSLYSNLLTLTNSSVKEDNREDLIVCLITINSIIITKNSFYIDMKLIRHKFIPEEPTFLIDPEIVEEPVREQEDTGFFGISDIVSKIVASVLPNNATMPYLLPDTVIQEVSHEVAREVVNEVVREVAREVSHEVAQEVVKEVIQEVIQEVLQDSVDSVDSIPSIHVQPEEIREVNEPEYNLRDRVEVFFQGCWISAVITSIFIKDHKLFYTTVFQNGTTADIGEFNVRNISKKKENMIMTVKKLKEQIVLAMAENDIDKAIKLGKLLKTLT